MAMAAPTNMSLFHLLFLVIVFTTTTITMAATSAPPSPSGEALAFLRSRCANTTNATLCYNVLLPFAGSFHGSQVKISTAAIAVAFPHFESFLEEAKRVQAAGGMGTGRRGDEALRECVDDLELILDTKTQTFASLRVLDDGGSGGSSKEKLKYALHKVKIYVSSGGADGCIEDLTDAGDAALSSSVAKKVMAMATDCNQYQQIAFALVLGITL